jgi:hypothetical protein
MFQPLSVFMVIFPVVMKMIQIEIKFFLPCYAMWVLDADVSQ